MPTTMTCTECDALMTLKATTAVGAKVKCPKCSAINVVPGPTEDQPRARKGTSTIKPAPSACTHQAETGRGRRAPRAEKDGGDYHVVFSPAGP